MNPIVNLPEPLVIGLHALVVLGRDNSEYISTHRIAQAIGASEPYSSKILQSLAKGGYVESLKGPGGGYRLKNPVDELYILPIFELLGGPFSKKSCDLAGCAGRTCFIASMTNELADSIKDFLSSYTLGHLLKYYDRSPEITLGVSVASGGQESKRVRKQLKGQRG